ncbi:PREDICTED: uncharacterized protein LOC109209245 [Nicotiana attenuata]|uniref:uncharacterized protein LOC109209245 n=1 Tax=Nicotiana attenuata TaxID=49451 RepID=UPI0009053203|nr:PREDICTED: uncharacterized protein LOC109209245 [Nicotiana attenuata]XP_019228019.1 PREDICTED: uncharacterized protein LOC109209245 [Nicotiana attenuata]
MTNRGQGIHHKDAASYTRVGLVESHEELNQPPILMGFDGLSLSSTGAFARAMIKVFEYNTDSAMSFERELRIQEITLSLQRLQGLCCVESEAGSAEDPSMNPILFLAERAMTIALLHPAYPFPSKSEFTKIIPGESKGWR